jgi:hypothetical protein
MAKDFGPIPIRLLETTEPDNLFNNAQVLVEVEMSNM